MIKCRIMQKWTGCYHWLLNKIFCSSQYSATPKDEPDELDVEFESSENNSLTPAEQVPVPRYEIE